MTDESERKKFGCGGDFHFDARMLDTQLIPASEGDSRWLMIVLHGLGDSMEGYRWLPGVMQLGWLNYLLVNAPTPYYGGFSWYDFAGDPGPDIEHSRKLLFSLLDDQRAAGFPTERTFVFGFSQGCLMAWEVGLGYPHLLAGLVGISGYCHAPEVWLRKLSPVALKQKFSDHSRNARCADSIRSSAGASANDPTSGAAGGVARVREGTHHCWRRRDVSRP